VRRRITTFLAGGLFALTLGGVATAGPFEDAAAAYQRGNCATALALWRPLAGQGDAKAQAALGAMYAYGLDVPQDYAAALARYHKAADQGPAEAQYNLGLMYDNGHGAPQGYKAALVWSCKAVEQGLAEGRRRKTTIVALARKLLAISIDNSLGGT
jgi:TPR repeat protein